MLLINKSGYGGWYWWWDGDAKYVRPTSDEQINNVEEQKMSYKMN